MSGTNPRVSSVMPVFNCDEFVGESIESVVNQTISDWELIVVDDGSSDGTIEVVQSWVERDPRISLIQLPQNRGNMFARNTGVAAARGSWIATMDADDLSLPQRFEKQLAYLDEHPEVDMLGGRILLFEFDATKPSLPKYRPGGVLYGAMPGAHATMMFRRSCFDRYGLYDDTFRLSGDHELIMRWYCQGAGAAALDEPIAMLRRYGGNITLNRKREQTKNTLRVYWRTIFKYRKRLHPKGYLLALEYLAQYLYLVSQLDRIIPRKWIHFILRRRPTQVE